jgi:hypothetical protein
MTKLCKDCRFGHEQHPGQSGWVCMHPSSTVPPGPPSPVTGASLSPVQLDCPRARSILGGCGPEGIYWEPRSEPPAPIGSGT